MAWRISGRSVELCSCKLLCPCWLGPADPDQGWCSAAVIFDIQRGDSDGVDLSGTRAAFAADWPGDFWSGQGTLRLYVDEAASAEQRREIEAIFSGSKGGPMEALGSAVISQVLPIQVTKIDLQWGERPAMTIGAAGQVTLQPVTDQAGQPTKVVSTAAQAAFQFESVGLASSKGSRWSDPELRQWEGDSGTIWSFEWSA